MNMEQASGAAYAAAKGSGAHVLVGGIGLAGAISLAAIVVMLVKRPRTAGEWALALISTFMCSLGLGAAIVLYFGLLKWVLVPDPVEAFVGLMALLGVVFAAGLPGWVLVRIAFNTMGKFQDASADDLYKEAKGLLP